MDIRRATIDDTGLLIRARLDFLLDLWPVTPEKQEALTRELQAYYPAHIEQGDFVALLGFEGDELAATAFMTYSDFPPNDRIMAARRAMAGGIFTYPAHRRRGHASKLVLALADIARAEGAAILDLYATEAGMKVYEKIGFTKHNDTAMRLFLTAKEDGSP